MRKAIERSEGFQNRVVKVPKGSEHALIKPSKNAVKMIESVEKGIEQLILLGEFNVRG